MLALSVETNASVEIESATSRNVIEGAYRFLSRARELTPVLEETEDITKLLCMHDLGRINILSIVFLLLCAHIEHCVWSLACSWSHGH